MPSELVDRGCGVAEAIEQACRRRTLTRAEAWELRFLVVLRCRSYRLEDLPRVTVVLVLRELEHRIFEERMAAKAEA